MSLVDRNLTQEVTYWAPSALNRYGQPGFDEPQVLKGRWEAHIQQVRKPDDTEVTSTTRVFVNQDVAIGGKLALGDMHEFAEPTDLAFEIQGFVTVPDLRGLSQQRQAFL